MATVKVKGVWPRARLELVARRLDFLEAHACATRSPAAWDTYHEAVKLLELLGFNVARHGTAHEVTPC